MTTRSLRQLPDRVANWFNWRRLWQGETAQDAPYAMHHRRVYILPTRIGASFALMLLVMLIGSINYVNSLGYLLTFLLTGLAIVAIVATYRNILNLRVSLGRLHAAFCGEQVYVPVLLNNRGCPARYAVTIYYRGDNPVTTDLPASRQHEVSLPQRPKQRGYHPAGRFLVETRFPLGLFRAWSQVNLRASYLVYPQPASVARPLPDPGAHHLGAEGTQGRGSGDFAGLRGYRHGDSLRHVHWKAAAREQGLLTKQFGGDRHQELWLDWDLTGETGTEERLSRLTRWVLDAEHAGMRYGLRLPGGEVPPGHGERHKAEVLRSLALYGLSSSIDERD